MKQAIIDIGATLSGLPSTLVRKSAERTADHDTGTAKGLIVDSVEPF